MTGRARALAEQTVAQIGGTDGGGSGGSKAMGSGGDAVGTGHCSPGKNINGAFLYQQSPCKDWNIDNPEAGLDEDAGLSMAAVQLGTPTTASEPYAISSEYLTNYYGTVEFYATDGECGKMLEKLSSTEVTGNDFACFDSAPTGNYEWLVRVLIDVTGSLGSSTFCLNVTCK